MQDPLDPLPLDSSSLPPLLDSGAELAPFTALQLPLEPPSMTNSTLRGCRWLICSACPSMSAV